ncbi:hypothetical protein JCM8547_004184 [Rhodosporidiobolus lusitaniae]
MKFNQYLQAHAIDEWRRAYINYRQLKKQIGRAEEELIRLDEGDEEKDPGLEGAGARREGRREERAKEARNGGGGERGEQRERDLERGRGSEEADDETASPHEEGRPRPSRPVSPLSVSSAPHDPAHSPLASPGLSQVSDGSRNHSDETGTTSRPLVRTLSRSSKHSLAAAAAHVARPTKNLVSRPSQQDRKKDSPRGPNRRWREGLSPNMELEELYEHLSPQCRRFFTLLDRELERVTQFYADREHEAEKRFDELSAQWKELANHKKEFQAHRGGDCAQPNFVSSFLPKHAHLPPVPGSNLVRRAVGQRSNKGRQQVEASRNGRRMSASSVESRGHEGGERNGFQPHDAQEVKPSPFKHGRPEEYSNARSKLKLATFEYYRYLGMIKSYRVLNRTGFAKGLKKFEKATAIPCAAKYRQKVEAANFVSSEKLDELIRKTEDAFAETFERGDRKKALERLRDFGTSKRHHFTSWRGGVMMGAGLVFMIEGLVQSFKASTRREIPYWPALMQLFGACFLPIFFCLAFFLNLAAWSHARINYVLIFELDVRTRMQYVQFIELPALLYFILSLFWWAAWNNFWPGEIEPNAYPLAWLVVTVLIMFNPLPVLYPSARWWMLRSFTRMITSGLVAVEFRDFFLGDEMNSLYYSVYNLGFLYCTYNHGWPSNTMSVCSTNKTWSTPILSALPAFWRLGQSIRRYLDSDGVYLHLLNAGKYSASITYFFFYYSWRIRQQRDGEDETWRFALFIVFATINSVWTSAWDLLMDWSLFHRDVKKKSHRFLREELGFFKDQPWVYFVACVLNVVLRFSWVLYLAPEPALPVQGYVIALLECGRRIMWNTLRVEAEHIGNRDGYRVTRDVSLPYVTASSPEASTSNGSGSTADDDPSDDSLTPRQRAFAAIHRLHASVVKNLRPVVDAFGEAGQWVSLGRRVDEGEKERRRVEREAREEDGEMEERERRRRKDYERKKRKRRGTLGGGGDESSSGSGDGEEEESGKSGSRSASDETDAEAGRAGEGAGRKKPLSPARRGDSDHEQSDVSDVEGNHDDAEDRQLEEGMAEVEGMNRGLGKAGTERMEEREV